MEQPHASTNPSHFLGGKTILVARAGIAGLAFAVALAQQFTDLPSDVASKSKVIIFEWDSYEECVGREGYTLSLRSDNRAGGVQVLDRLGLYESVRSVSVHADNTPDEAGSFNVWDSDFHLC